MSRVALYGGVFDPVHNGHIAVAEQILDQLQPDELLVLPCGRPPHKRGRRVSDGKDRLQMLRMAFAHLPCLTVSSYELDKPGASYTAETLAHFRALYGSDTELIWVIGADNIRPFFTWYQPEKILQLANIAVLARPGFDRSEAEEAFPGCYIIGGRQVDASSTRVREMARRGERLSSLVPPGVEAYVYEHRLYPPRCTAAQAEELVKQRLSPHRAEHTFGVRETAVRLAERFGEDPKKAEMAALLHDITKQLPLEEQLSICQKHGIVPDKMQQSSPALLHSMTAEATAFYELGIDDNEILAAIRYHTTGCPGMSRLMELIYLADCIEPGREAYPGLDAIRLLAEENLEAATLAAMERGMAYLQETGRAAHPDTLCAIKDLQERMEQSDGIKGTDGAGCEGAGREKSNGY